MEFGLPLSFLFFPLSLFYLNLVDRLSELLLGSCIELPQSCSSNSDQNHTEAPVSSKCSPFTSLSRRK